MIAGPVNYGSLWTDLAILVFAVLGAVVSVYIVLRLIERKR